MTETVGDYQSVERALRVLEDLADHGPRGVSELAAVLALDKSVVSRMMKTLNALGYVALAGQKGRYQLGPKILYLGRHFLSDNNLLVLARPILRDLAEEARATAVMAMPVGRHLLVLSKQPSPERLRAEIEIGNVLPPHASAIGKVLLAGMKPKERAPFLIRPLSRFTDATITDRARLDAALQQAAEAGYAVEIGEEDQGVGCIAAPVRDRSGHWIAAVSASGPLHGTQFAIDEHHIDLVMNAAAAISEQLGFRAAEHRASGLVS
jgi:IclR family transcriptional regulator, acetate operon repressor